MTTPPASASPPPLRKGLAIASLVLGVLSLPTCGLLGIGALVGIRLGIGALLKAKKAPHEFGVRLGRSSWLTLQGEAGGFGFPQWACGAAGSAREWHSRGHGFDPHQLHQLQQQLSETTNRRHGRFVYFLSILDGTG